MSTLELFENIDVEAIPTEDIAQWLVKADRAQFALSEQHWVDRADEQSAYMLADPNPEPKEYWLDPARRAEAYEISRLYVLEGAITLAGIKRALELPNEEPIDVITPPEDVSPMSISDIQETAGRISSQALVEGLGRLGMIDVAEDGTKTAPDALVAALMYKRADITQNADRRLYDRAESIEDFRKYYETWAGTHATMIDYEGKKWPVSIYRAIDYNMEDGQPLGKAAKFDKWWFNLEQEFRRIDEIDATNPDAGW